MSVYLTELLNSGHNRKDFTCGKSVLDNYLYFQANQDMKKNLSACFIWNDTETKRIKGYYTLSSNSIPIATVTEQYRKKITAFLPCRSDYFIGQISR
jgi:hypothetical protein